MILYTLHNNGYIDFSEKVKLFPKEKFNMYVNFTNRCNCNCTFASFKKIRKYKSFTLKQAG